jgi:hypothetical protein
MSCLTEIIKGVKLNMRFVIKDLWKNLFRRIIKFKVGHRFSKFLLNHIQPLEIVRNWWTSPFNGQARRMYNMYVLSHELEPSHVIETGTFIGSSTYLFLGIPSVQYVISIEANLEYQQVAQSRYSNLFPEKLLLQHGDSKIEFKSTLKSLDPSQTRLLCYLDAHWEGDIPTINELEALVQWDGFWLAIVDDFKVPYVGTSEYGFDRYGHSSVDLDIIPKVAGLRVFLPDEPAEMETGAKRGTAYIFSKNYMPSNLVLSKLRLREVFLNDEKSS